MTLGEAKKRLEEVSIRGMDLTDAVNEVCGRAYDIGRWPDASKELLISTSDLRQDSSGEYDGEWFCYIDADLYDGALGFLVDGCPVRIRPISSIYGVPASGWGGFIDMGLVLTGSDWERRYKMPNGVTSSKRISALVKKRWVNVYDDASLIPIRSLAALKAGILALNYENENDIQLAAAKWREMEELLLRDDKQFAGTKTINIPYKSYYNRRPTSFF